MNSVLLVCLCLRFRSCKYQLGCKKDLNFFTLDLVGRLMRIRSSIVLQGGISGVGLRIKRVWAGKTLGFIINVCLANNFIDLLLKNYEV